MTAANNRSSVRIIAGKWRGRRINFPTIQGVRPTHDRIRETLFNWLQRDISGAICLDLFAGSGALGIEALSRGAEHVTFIDSSKEAVSFIKSNLQKLACESSSVLCANIPDNKLIMSPKTFDVIFLDPPFSQGLMLPAIAWLKDSKLISRDTIFYYEMESGNQASLHSLQLNIYREKKTANINYGLFTLPFAAQDS